MQVVSPKILISFTISNHENKRQNFKPREWEPIERRYESRSHSRSTDRGVSLSTKGRGSREPSPNCEDLKASNQHEQDRLEKGRQDHPRMRMFICC